MSQKIQEKPIVITYHNDMNKRLSLSSLSSVQLDIFFAIIAALRLDKDADGRSSDVNEAKEVTLTFDQLKELSNYSQSSDTRFKKYLIEIYKKILSIHFVIDTEDSYTSFNLFSLFKIWDKKVMIVTNPARSYILDTLDKNFTIMKLRMLTDIPTAYGKNLARLLSQYRSTGLAVIPIDGESGIRNQFGALTTPMKDITRRIIKPSVKLVSKYFPDLKYEYVRDKGSGRKIKAIKFTFEPGKGIDDEEYYFGKKTVVNDCLPSPDASVATQICPECGQPLIERVMNGKTVWCHADGYRKDAKCSRIFNTVAEIQGFSETPERTDKDREAARIVSEGIEKCKKEGGDMKSILESLGIE